VDNKRGCNRGWIIGTRFFNRLPDIPAATNERTVEMEQTTIERIEKSPFYRELVQAEKAQLVDKRKAAAQALATLTATPKSESGALSKQYAEAEKVAAEAEKHTRKHGPGLIICGLNGTEPEPRQKEKSGRTMLF
jgi:hypothetical protein